MPIILNMSSDMNYCTFYLRNVHSIFEFFLQIVLCDNKID